MAGHPDMKLIEYPDRDMLAIDLAQILAGELTATLQHEDRATLVVPGGNPPRDTFIRFETTNATASGGGSNVNWNGFLAVNGRNVGRLEALGPQRTLYVPGSYLRRGANDVLVFDATGRLRGRPPALVSQGWAELGPSVPW